MVMRHPEQSYLRMCLTILTCGLMLQSAHGQKKNELELEKIPKKVMATLKAKFPKAEIRKWTQETERDPETDKEFVLYDIEMSESGRKFEADIKEDGTIHNWEKEVDAKEVPKAVLLAVEKKYPKSTLNEIMLITEVKGAKEQLEGYEIVLKTADQKDVEVMVAPDGKILEDTGAMKE